MTWLILSLLLLSVSWAMQHESLVSMKVIHSEEDRDEVLDALAKNIESDYPTALQLMGRAGGLRGYYIFKMFHPSHKRAEDVLDELVYNSDNTIQWARVEETLGRERRQFNDPLRYKQWHLDKLKLENVWNKGITGKGIIVSVVDDGLDFNHDDFKLRYVPEASYDFNFYKPDPLPSLWDDIHGTRCAGEIAASANNHRCGVGVAYECGIAAERILSGPVSDIVEASALSYARQLISIYSNSWGPYDDGKTVEAPGILAQLALEQGVEMGRGGLGSIYVFASGNGGPNDNCGMDGYVGSPYTIAIGALDRNDEIPEYQEVCAAQMAVTYSSNNKDYIVTTDTKSGCTDRHGGTSAAAPIAAGLIALVLQVNPLLSWRDVQWLIAKTSIKVNPDHPDWMTNAAGFHHNHYYGFGNLDITAMIQEASEWESIDKSYTSLQWKSSSVSPEQIDAFDSGSFVVEHVIVELDVDRVKGKGRGDIQVQLISPSGTPSWLVTQRTEDRATPSGFDGWKVMTVRCWGESPEGVWKLNVMNGRLNSWVLNVYGSQ